MHGVCNGLKGLWIMLMQTEAANHDLSLSVVQLLQPAGRPPAGSGRSGDVR
jgi:hypothetical protein